MTQRLIIEYTGWAQVDAADIEFVYLGSDCRQNPHHILGDEWLALPEDKRNQYVIASMVAVLAVAEKQETEIVAIEQQNDTTTEQVWLA